MSFDLSRIRFDARRDFLGVVMQQGRVQLDADWNEWVSQLARRIQAGTLDTFNGSVVPRTTPDAFHIDASGGALSIGVGRMYVDGLLAENHGAAPLAWEPRLAGLQGTEAVDYAAQPYLPNPPELPQSGRHLVYLDVWQRAVVTAVEDPSLIEQAVGVDTTGRLQTVWQVKILEDVGDEVSCATPEEDIPGWPEATAPSAGRLSTDTAVPSFEPDPCRIAPSAGYRGLENQTYRVQVHTGGPLGTATFKWSRDNASVSTRVTHIDSARTTITVESTGRDETLGFNDGDWIEITDDWRELHGLPGELRRVTLVDINARTLRFEPALTNGLFPTGGDDETDPLRNTRITRWDQGGEVHAADGSVFTDLNALGAAGDIDIPPAGTQLFLEHGIVVEFDLDPAGGEFRSGDYWVFVARSSTGDIEELDSAPPLGIHHHYARLAVVDLPEDETDCRTLWPPISDGGGCDCTVCVSAEDHNSGTHTLQQAIDSIKDTGGTVCLGIGSYAISAPINIHDGRSLRLRGQGWGTILQGGQTGGLIDIDDTSGIALENLTLMGSGGNADTTAMIAVRDSIDFRAEHINVLGFAVGDGTSVGIALTGNVLGARISDCAIVAERGISALAREGANYALTGELRAERNLFFCSQHAVHLAGASLHAGNTRIDDNLIFNGNRSALLATGAVLPGSTLQIARNCIYTNGDGIVAGVDALSITGNEISGWDENGRHGIVIEEGLDPVAIDALRIGDNRIRHLQGNAISLNAPISTTMITHNQIDDIGLSALLMADAAEAAHLVFSANQCSRVGQTVTGDDLAYAAIQLVHITRGDITDNALGYVALNSTAAPAVDGIRILGCEKIAIDGNRLFGIGPVRSAGQVTGIRILPPFDRISIVSNEVERRGDETQQLNTTDWQAIRIHAGVRELSPAIGSVTAFVAAETHYVLTASRLRALPGWRPDVSIRGNQLRGERLAERVTECRGLFNIQFSENTCETDSPGATPNVALLAARTVTANHNLLLGVGDQHTLHAIPGGKQAIVMGNTSTGMIATPGAGAIPNDLSLTNIIGI